MHCDLLIYDKIFEMGELSRHSITDEIYLTFQGYLDNDRVRSSQQVGSQWMPSW